MTRRLFVPSILAVLLTTTGCMVGPNYKRPPAGAPDTFRGQSEVSPSTASVADEPWAQMFPDPVLQSLIRTALQQNTDARLAAVRILEAQAQLGITRADQFPQVSAGANVLA